MEYQRLGRTGLEVSVIGIGTEHLHGQPRETVHTVIREAIERGVNYFDLVFSFPDYLDVMGSAFAGHRDQVLLTAHLGSTEKNGQYCKTRSVRQCETFFLDALSRMQTDQIDILFLHNFNSISDWTRASRPGSVFDLALRLKEEGRARHLGISGHYPGVVEQAVASGTIDVVMFPVNLFGHAMPGRMDLQEICVQHNIGLVAMKPFGGGRLLTGKGTLRVPKYQTGGESFRTSITTEISPVQCLSYTLAQMGVSLALPGVKDNAELSAALRMIDAPDEERDFSGLLEGFGRYEEGACVYCNHCLPCPESIDIAQALRLLDAAQVGRVPAMQATYNTLRSDASACNGCGACTARCPFGVDVVASMARAATLFAA